MPPSDPRSDPGPDAAARARHWRRTRGLTAVLLAAWFAVGFVVPWFARELDFRFFGWPFGFWACAQGGVVLFVALIAIYARRMRRLDRLLDAPPAPGPAPQAAGPEVVR